MRRVGSPGVGVPAEPELSGCAEVLGSLRVYLQAYVYVFV